MNFRMILDLICQTEDYHEVPAKMRGTMNDFFLSVINKLTLIRVIQEGIFCKGKVGYGNFEGLLYKITVRSPRYSVGYYTGNTYCTLRSY